MQAQLPLRGTHASELAHGGVPALQSLAPCQLHWLFAALFCREGGHPFFQVGTSPAHVARPEHHGFRKLSPEVMKLPQRDTQKGSAFLRAQKDLPGSGNLSLLKGSMSG
ncbi:hypothetical protein UC35_14845 [Ramlibacter tataouinensis]|uniref:Uncharacterized protein n=1 Tax=Ramlibacter tataouinensis TaxID=94132 RepID=A0A127JV75_9BURK|nr:hypothetical protein UC35_14845 [Ramlibacter tataouinensis]